MNYTMEEIVDDIIQNINEYRKNNKSKMPSENELSDKYSVPRVTIRKCFDKLEEMGFIYSIQGKGRYLKEEHQCIELQLSGSKSFTEKVKDKHSYYVKNIGCSVIDYNEEIYNKLEISKDTKVFKVGLLRFINDEPIALHISYLSEDIFKNISSEGENITSMYKYFKSYGYDEVTTEDSLLRMIYPSKYERELLDCKILTPIFRIKSKKKCYRDKRIVECSEILYRCDRFEYTI